MKRCASATVRVVDVRTYKGEVVYVGRGGQWWAGHPLAGPYSMKGRANAGARAEARERYRHWLLGRPTLDDDLAALWERTGRGRLPLGHTGDPEGSLAQVLAGVLEEACGRPAPA